MTPYSFKQKNRKSITLEDIIQARNNLVNIMTKYENGEDYLPIFKRLQNEIAIRKESEALMSEVKQISKSIFAQ